MESGAPVVLVRHEVGRGAGNAIQAPSDSVDSVLVSDKAVFVVHKKPPFDGGHNPNYLLPVHLHRAAESASAGLKCDEPIGHSKLLHSQMY